MKFKKFMALGLVAAMTATLFAGCGSKGSDSADGTQKADSASSDGLVSYSDIVLGETGKDLSATITMFNHRTDMDTDDYGGKNWKSYLEDFNKEYPNIKVEITTDTNYADDALTHLQSGQYETITMIPAVDKIAEFIHIERCYHLHLTLGYPLASIGRHYGLSTPLLVLLNLEQLVQTVDISTFALVGHHQESLDAVVLVGIQLFQGLAYYILLEGYIIDIGTNAAGYGSLRPRTDKLIRIWIPRLGLYLYQFDVVAIFLQNIHTHKQITETESRLSDVHLVALHQFLGAL
ncbi:MAG: hypothetical protein SPL82_05420 [Lachnospiraceae bacterium]|nr:hypothetical protein [Lachnospiraceae bacterium]